MKSILQRIIRIESQMKRDPLILLMMDGSTMSARDAVAQGCEWQRVISGSDLRDLDLLLKTLKEIAERDYL